MGEFTAKYPATCGECKLPINVGDKITWTRRGESKTFHASCSNKTGIPPTDLATSSNICGKCGGVVQVGVTRAKKVGGENVHIECYFPNKNNFDDNGKFRERNQFGAFVTPLDSDNTPQTKAVGGVAVEAPKPEGKKSQAADGLLGLIAAEVKNLIKDEVSQKVDEKQVAAIAETIANVVVNQTVDKHIQDALKAHTKTIIINDKATGEVKELEGLQHKQVAQIIALINLGYNVYLGGESGGGKTHAVGQVAKALNRKLYVSQQSKQAQPSEFKGNKTPNGELVSTQFREWFLEGGILLCEEFDAWSDNLRVMLNTALDNGIFAFPDGVKLKHKDAIAVACGNTTGGADARYSGRDSFDASVKQRFYFVHWEYDEVLERKIAVAINKDAGKLVDWVQFSRRKVKELGLRVVVSPRASISGAGLLGVDTIENIADGLVFWGCAADAKEKILHNNALPRYRVAV